MVGSGPSEARRDSLKAVWARRLITWGPILLLIGLLVWTGLRGVDFGYHWDEQPAQIDPVAWSIRHSTLLPNSYIYPSVNHWLNLIGVLPWLGRALWTGVTAEEFTAALLIAPKSPDYLLVLRSIRIVVASLAPLWTYLAVLAWRRSRREALLAACFLGLSWEIAYHARWVAPDAVVMQFGALTLLFSILAVVRPEQARWRRLAAVAAALATGTKYPAGLLILPVLVASVYTRPGERTLPSGLRVTYEVVLLFAGTFLLTTPGALLQPREFLRDLGILRTWYGQGHHGYTVDGGIPHLGLMLEYVGLVLMSPYVPVAAALTLGAIAGTLVIWKESRRLAAVLVLFPVVYVAYFATQGVMIVRNLLVLAPFLALLAGRGATEGVMRIPWRVAQRIFAGVVIIAILANGAWLVYAAETIHSRKADRPVAALSTYMGARTDKSFLVSPRVAADLGRIGKVIPSNASMAPVRADLVAVYAFEAMPNLEWPANIRGLTVRTFGPLEANFDYYPTWEGNDRIVVMTLDRACAAGVDVVEAVCP